MKILGKTISGPNVELIVIPRGNGEDIILKAQAVLNPEDFNKICPEPKAPTQMIRGGQRSENITDPGYKSQMELYKKHQFAWLVIESLKATDGLEWETILPGEPSTWENYEKELTASGFSVYEVGRIVQAVMVANCLNEDRIEEARKRFLDTQADLVRKSMTQVAVLNSTQSSEPAKDSV